jgi:DMSO/TMAO reductase YedYZ molybdopterin-dependent catalytic subunit
VAERPQHVLEREGVRVGRGVFLLALAGGASSLWWGGAAQRLVSSALGPVTSRLPLLPGGGWRIYTVSDHMPRFDPATWRLEIGGLVRRPATLTYDELRRFPRATQTSDFHCVTGWTVRNVGWGGVRLRHLLDLVDPLPAAGAIRFVSTEDPYVDSLSLAQANLPDAMLAYEMNGRPLAREHGAPVRLVIPEMYGYKNVKWVRRLELVDSVENGYWENLGYDRNAWVGRSNGYGA